MKKLTNTTQRVRAMIDSGHTNKAIIEKLKCKPHAVYNTRYQMNKARGLGSIGELPNPTNGIGAPPKRKETGIVLGGNVGGLILTDMGNGTLRWVRPPVSPYASTSEMQITMVEPTLWQRIKGWFRG